MKLKIILLVQLIMMITKIGYPQNLNGKYYYGMEHGNRIISFENGHFNDERKEGSFRVIGKGSYKLKDSLLLMNYTRIKSSDSSTYKLAGKLNKNKVTQVSLDLNYEDGTPAEALIAIFDSDHNMLVTYPIDKFGKSSFTIDHEYDYLILSIVGMPYYPVHIPVKKLKNKSTSIKAILKEKRFAYMQPAKVIYVMKKNENGTLILKSEENANKQLWKKID